MILQHQGAQSFSKASCREENTYLPNVRTVSLLRRARQHACATAKAGRNPFAAPTSVPSITQGNEPDLTSSSKSDGWSSHTWKWRGHTIHYKTAGCGEPIVLVHGFGLSSFHYRRNIPILAKNYKVYAIDLLGFGKSSKPITQYRYFLRRLLFALHPLC